MKTLLYFLSLILLTTSMNAQKNDPKLIALFEKQSFTYDTTTIGYRFFQPKEIDPAKKYPLVLTLHGAGERGSDNERQITYHGMATTWVDPMTQEEHPSFVVAPQCPEKNKWVDISWGSETINQDTVQLSNELDAVIHLVDKIIAEYPIDENRIYVTGLSMGGFGTWDLITRFPDKFAAAIPMSGAGDPTKAGKIKHMPIWVCHGALDRTVPVEGSRNMVNALRELGSEVLYTELPDKYHNIWKPLYENKQIIDWLFEQRLKK